MYKCSKNYVHTNKDKILYEKRLEALEHWDQNWDITGAWYSMRQSTTTRAKAHPGCHKMKQNKPVASTTVLKTTKSKETRQTSVIAYQCQTNGMDWKK